MLNLLQLVLVMMNSSWQLRAALRHIIPASICGLWEMHCFFGCCFVLTLAGLAEQL